MSSFLSITNALSTLLISLLLRSVLADPAIAPFTDCFDEDSNPSLKLEISAVYAQVLDVPDKGTHLNLTVLGRSPQVIEGFTNTSTSLATLFTTTSVLTLNAWTNSSYLCSTLRPPSPLPPVDNTTGNYCPIPAGDFAFSSSIPWGRHRALTTLTTRLRAVDPAINELLCIDVTTTPLHPRQDSPYGNAKIILWSTVALAIAYWIVVGLARIVSAWGRGTTRHEHGLWSRAQSAGFILASAISGERLATSPALMRFCTPSLRDIMFHTQWCAALAMVAVEWPPFVYPLLAQTAWSTLSYNITVLPSTASHRWNPLSTLPFDPPSNFADQLNDSQSPLFIDTNVRNTLFTLPDNATHGLSSFAYAVGLRPQDLFPVCLILFLGILAAAIGVAILLWLIDYLACSIVGILDGSGNSGPSAVARLTGARSPGFSSIKDTPDIPAALPEEQKSLNGNNAGGASLFKPPSRFGLPLSAGGSIAERGIASHRAWWRLRTDIGSFHGSVLHGNLVRILILFHLPVTIFSVYQMTMSREHASLSSKALAGLSFTLFSILLPAHLALRVTFNTTSKLYDETRTLLSLGPLYNHYRHGSQLFASLLFATNLAFGITIGAGQKSGTAQAIVILVIEIISALVTSIWLPWGTGASMGLISFLFCVARIVVAVLLLILSPTISIGPGAGGWVAYGILVILALVFLALLLMLIVKVIEALVRIFGGISFDRSKHVVDSGLLGACGLLGCCGPRKRRSKRRARHKTHRYKPTELQAQVEHRDSDVSSYVPPTFPAHGASTPPRFHGSDSRKGSSHSGPPPSVLRPEHAMRPYREDTEDEGYIMGAWQPFPKAGYAPVVSESPVANTPKSTTQQLTKPSQSTLTVAQSGFSRVGGGRAHIDAPYAIATGSTHTSPYAIATGSTHTFPSIGQQSTPTPVFYDDDSPPPSLSNVEGRQPDLATLPPGAMQPSHIRTKSQTAVVENADLLASMQGPSSSSGRPQQQEIGSGGLLRPPVMTNFPAEYDDADSEEVTPKKKPWYHLRRSRAHSNEGPSAAGASTSQEPRAAPVDEELGGLGHTPQPQRSFVVIRKSQPGSAGARTTPTT
ncbi:putative transient receptor potential (TRP) ion channel [Lyophyllum shimeji]|uniref:Transient receptor potential (TRP) ion channel n=1 Tax=Lyophyllum shimeji TaxID=47721 RepID=A0A9P3PE31_LYOSH|nr:putative transient receptor potential (TRP) ion channel [Lyophyllum shimeji]